MPTPSPDDYLPVKQQRRKEFSRDIGQDWVIRELNGDLVATYKPTGANFVLVVHP